MTVVIRSSRTLADEHHELREYSLACRSRDGNWRCITREAYHRGDSAVALLYSESRGTILLTKQFRLPVLICAGRDGMLIEAPGGMLDGDSPAQAARREAEEETGCRITRVEEAFIAFMSPASVAERVHFFVADYEWTDQLARRTSEDEEIELLERPLDEAVTMLKRGEIVNGRTILLLQYLKLRPREREA